MKKNFTTDEQLADAFLTNQSTDSFGLLYDRYINKVYKTCLSITKDSCAAQDYTQDIFIKVFDRLDSFRNRSSFSTWLYAITYYYCMDQIRLTRRLPVESLPDDLTGEAEPWMSDPGRPESIELSLLALENAMKHLPPAEIDLLRLKYEQGLSIQALSARFQLSESAVKMRLKRSRDKIQQLYVNPLL